MVIDLRKIKNENISNVIKIVLAACNVVEKSGKNTSIKVKKKKKTCKK